jgi:uncharacterized phage-associated protein
MTNNPVQKTLGLILIYASIQPIKRTSLNKLLFFSDVFHLLKTESTITMSKYFKRPYGPVPEYIDEIRKAMIEDSLLAEEETMEYSNYVFNYRTELEKGLVEKIYNEWFLDAEKETIKLVGQTLINWNASELSRKSHEFEPWKSAKWNEKLDLSKCLADDKLKEWYLTISQ